MAIKFVKDVQEQYIMLASNNVNDATSIIVAKDVIPIPACIFVLEAIVLALGGALRSVMVGKR
jgi:hypothetical protein